MAKETRRKLLHYRRCNFHLQTGKTLQQLLEASLNKLVGVGSRKERFGSDDPGGSSCRFINIHRSALGMQFGSFVSYTGGQNQHILEVDDEADELNIEQIAPPQGEDGRRYEFLDSILYYGVMENHVILLQSKSLKSREFELHLNWLLRQSQTMSDDNVVFLNNFVPQITKAKLEQSTVKSIKLGLPLYDNVDPVDSGDAHTVRFRPNGEGIEILNILAPNRIKELSGEDLAESSNLEVFVEVTYKHQTDEGSQKLLNKLSAALRNVGDDDIKIELKGAGTIVGSELQIKSFKNIATSNGLVDPTDVFDKMNEWLIDNLEMGYIDPE